MKILKTAYISSFYLLLFFLTGYVFSAKAQEVYPPEGSILILPQNTHYQVINGDTIYMVELPNIQVTRKRKRYPERPLTLQERREMWRLIRDVKKTLPIAKELSRTLIETYEYLDKLPTDKARNKHLKLLEGVLKEQYEPQMRNLTLRQGKLLIKLVARQTNQSSYKIVDAFFGGWKAFWWNSFANMFGASLKTEYNPKYNKEDALTERIIRLVEAHRL